MIDMTVPGNRTNVVLITLESSLAFYAKFQMWPGGVSALKVCWRDGYSHHRTAASALRDIIALRRMMDETYEPSDLIVEALHKNPEKAQVLKRMCIRKGDKWRKEGRPGAV